ncbi:MAG: tryptophan-rich sensory protein [Planctomycetes bacterium]|nr:tryptophan-rich sensory protein [Planctomycetota bacterium]
MEAALKKSDVRHTGATAYVALIGWVLLSFAPSLTGVFFGPGDWYRQLEKPFFNPPNWIFGPVWTTLYLLMGISAWLVWRRGSSGWALKLFIVQLALNALWTPVFFGLHALGAALIVIVAMWLAILATIIAFWKLSRPGAAMLIPYLLWVSFATLLNASLWWLN